MHSGWDKQPLLRDWARQKKITKALFPSRPMIHRTATELNTLLMAFLWPNEVNSMYFSVVHRREVQIKTFIKTEIKMRAYREIINKGGQS